MSRDSTFAHSLVTLQASLREISGKEASIVIPREM